MSPKLKTAAWKATFSSVKIVKVIISVLIKAERLQPPEGFCYVTIKGINAQGTRLLFDKRLKVVNQSFKSKYFVIRKNNVILFSSFSSSLTSGIP